jgi:3-dehydroquinate synthase
MKKIDIYLSPTDKKSGSYPVYVGRDFHFSDLLATHVTSDVLIITNEILAPLYLEKLHEGLSSHQKRVVSCVIADGEKYKSLESFSQIMQILLKENFHRDVTLIALGGGVIGDLTGFVAATFMRGVSFVQIPTSLLAQVDASLGGKTAINHPAGKNMIGAFHQPQAVLIDVNFLDTLPQQEFISGMAEVIKHALILDRHFFNFLVENQQKIFDRDKAIVAEMIFYSCQIKSKIIEQDEKEHGLRAILNFGHTLGHAIEQCSNYQILHGHAVSIGMAFALKLSCRFTNFPRADYVRCLDLLSFFQLPMELPSFNIDELWSAMSMDKKHKGQSWQYILLNHLGEAVIYVFSGDDLEYVRALLEEDLKRQHEKKGAKVEKFEK